MIKRIIAATIAFAAFAVPIAVSTDFGAASKNGQSWLMAIWLAMVSPVEVPLILLALGSVATVTLILAFLYVAVIPEYEIRNSDLAAQIVTIEKHLTDYISHPSSSARINVASEVLANYATLRKLGFSTPNIAAYQNADMSSWARYMIGYYTSIRYLIADGHREEAKRSSANMAARIEAEVTRRMP